MEDREIAFGSSQLICFGGEVFLELWVAGVGWFDVASGPVKRSEERVVGKLFQWCSPRLDAAGAGQGVFDRSLGNVQCPDNDLSGLVFTSGEEDTHGPLSHRASPDSNRVTTSEMTVATAPAISRGTFILSLLPASRVATQTFTVFAYAVSHWLGTLG